ncbi:hypothetical protein DXG01_013982 [Tephrocybe rancida]|nr:hypothetical protein DXG01_013982 [Tephrocybe rancida]
MSAVGTTRRVPPRPPDPKKLFKRWRAPFRRTSSSISDVTRTSLVALVQSADAFPPLKSACGGVLAILDTAERVRYSRTNAQALAHRCFDILTVVADSTPDLSALSSEMKTSIARFNDLLNEIGAALDPIQKRGWVQRFAHLTRDEDLLQKFRQRLDDARQDLLTSTTLRTYCVVEAIDIRLRVIENHVKLAPPIQQSTPFLKDPQATFAVSVVLF